MKNLSKIPFLTIFLVYITQVSHSNAQSIITDNTTKTTPGVCTGNCTIRGGTFIGNNLFHSFSIFNVKTSSRVDFVDPGVINIITRVTGSDISLINGELAITGGNANIFLMNPNGIIFGPKSSLDIGGSLFATTANAIKFGNGGLLQASKTNISPELQINPSAVLFTSAKPKSITNQSVSPIDDVFETRLEPFGLNVPVGRSISLLGGDILLEGGGVNAFDGQVNLGGIAEASIIQLKKNGLRITLDYPDNKALANVTLSKGASVNTIGNNGGSIDVTGNNINLYDSRSFFSGLAPNQNQISTIPGNISINSTNQVQLFNSAISNVLLPGSNGEIGEIYINANSLELNNSDLQILNLGGDGVLGNVEVNVQGNITLANQSRINSLLAWPSSQGIGGNLNVKANNLFLNNESFIETSTFGIGNAGNIDLDINSSLVLSLDSLVISNVQTTGVGNGGAISIRSKLLSIGGGSQVAASILPRVPDNGIPSRPDLLPGPGGQGRGGNIQINADTVNINGFSSNLGFSSGIFVATEQGAVGPAGDINVVTDHFRITDGAVLNAQTINSSRGGSITVTANIFEALNGGQLITSTSSSGHAGNIKLNVTDKVLLSGRDITFFDRKNRFDGLVQNEGPFSGIYASSRLNSSGNAGSIDIDPTSVNIQNGAIVSVNSEGNGSAGNINIISGNLNLDQGNISAASRSNTGGNISLAIKELLTLRNNSSISTTASGDGTGGNILINTEFVIAHPTENSDITANAFNGEGGQIVVNSDGIIGLEVREQQTQFSDITAISLNNPRLNGTVIVNTPETDPTNNLSEQPEVVEPPQEIAQGCRPGQAVGGSTFTHVGRGGLPPSPHQTQTPTTIWQDLRAHNLQPTSISTTDPSPTSLIPTPPPSITEAQGWTKDTQGRIYLTAKVPQPTQTPQPITTC